MRKTEVYTVPTPKKGEGENRDAGRSFLLTEMAAIPLEKFVVRLVLALSSTGKLTPSEATELRAEGAAGLASMPMSPGEMLNGLPAHLVEPLLDDMMTCVTSVPDPTKLIAGTQIPINIPLDQAPDIEELSTLLALRGRLIDLHTGFSVSGMLSNMGARLKERLSSQ